MSAGNWPLLTFGGRTAVLCKRKTRENTESGGSCGSKIRMAKIETLNPPNEYPDIVGAQSASKRSNGLPL
jgi:hypothetical protein